jgi:hypothetical protein
MPSPEGSTVILEKTFLVPLPQIAEQSDSAYSVMTQSMSGGHGGTSTHSLLRMTLSMSQSAPMYVASRTGMTLLNCMGCTAFFVHGGHGFHSKLAGLPGTQLMPQGMSSLHERD